MLRNFKLLLPVLLIFLGLWYFFLKEYDYKIRFESPTSQGHIYQKLTGWKYSKLAPVKVASLAPFQQIHQTTDSINVDWYIEEINDSLSRVSVGIKHKEKKLSKRLQLLLGQPKFQKEIRKEIQGFKDAIEADKSFFKFSLEKRKRIQATTCACINLESKPEEKALEMMKNIDLLSNYILNNDLEMDGKPRVHITRWDLENNYINFDFCFPLKENENFPETPSIFIKKIPGFEAEQGRFLGNYMFTHYFWPQLLKSGSNSQQNEHIEILEIFKDNPELGGDASKWEAELYLLKK